MNSGNVFHRASVGGRAVRGFLLAALALLLFPRILKAHHEAIFGPQSSLVLSADRFLSFQVFSRQTGTSSVRTEETTGLVSAGVRLTKTSPLTVTAIVPYSTIRELDGSSRKSGAEDAILGLRYRWDLPGLQTEWDREGNFVMGMAAVELNNGSIDHRSWHGPADSMGALLGSLERGRWSGIGYTFYRRNGEDASKSKAGDSFFLGGGLAYTPGEDFETGRLVSYQAGVSFETYFKDKSNGRTDANTGGRELLLHPTVVWSPGHRVLFFGMVSVPVWRDFRDTTAQDRFRVGIGSVFFW